MTHLRLRNPHMMLFDQLLGNEYYGGREDQRYPQFTLPATNIIEDLEGYRIFMAAPGFDKSDFNIELNNNVLTISSDKKVENETKEWECYSRKEFSYQSFSRSFTLPNTIEGERISAKYDNGILKISLPKRDEAKPKPAIQITIE